ncbi:MAG: DUF4402 domain-containing protein [Alphaproteobacteria bacterium]|nr:DUF4402 domain-containing protein [Alphaproteobacteria bacterium]
MKKYLSLIAVSVLALGVNNANAITGTGNASATILQDTGITESQAMDFGYLLKGTSDHVVVLDTNNQRSGTNAYLVGGTAAKSGLFAITGAAGQDVKITVPTSFTLTNGTSTLNVSNVRVKIGSTGSEQAAGTNLAGAIDSQGGLELAVGGSLTVSSTATYGVYEGTYEVIVNY